MAATVIASVDLDAVTSAASDIVLPIGGGLAVVFVSVRLILLVIDRTSKIHDTADQVAERTIARAKADLELARADLIAFRDEARTERELHRARIEALEEQLAGFMRLEAEWIVERGKLEARIAHLEARLRAAGGGE